MGRGQSGRNWAGVAAFADGQPLISSIEISSVADLTVYAEIHNATAKPMKGTVTAAVAGVRVEQPIELTPPRRAHRSFSPQTHFLQLRIRDPKPWWPYQMGEPHLEHLTISFMLSRATSPTSKTSTSAFAKLLRNYTATGSRLFRVNGKPILIRGAGWSQDMLLRTDDGASCEISSAWCAT